MLANMLGSDTLIVVLIAVVVLFGGSQLPKIARNVGAAGHELRKAQREAESDHTGSGTAAPAQVVAAPVVAAPVVAAPVVAAPVVAAPNMLPVTGDVNAPSSLPG
jgi:TatA/E family protein of Tat protein translocase